MQHQRKLEQLFGNRPAFTRLPGIDFDMDDAVETVQEDSMTSADPPGMQRQQRLDKYTQQIKISHLQLLHIEVLTHKSDGMEQTSLVFLESELFVNVTVCLALRGHDLPLTSGQ